MLTLQFLFLKQQYIQCVKKMNESIRLTLGASEYVIYLFIIPFFFFLHIVYTAAFKNKAASFPVVEHCWSVISLRTVLEIVEHFAELSKKKKKKVPVA